MAGVLDGTRVLDFGRYIAGPWCSALLGDLGADVIRIEKLAGSEDRFIAPVAEDGAGAMFLQMNRNKRSMTLNPMKPEGREIVKKLVATADVVVANLPPQVLQEMGLDYDSLKAIKPDIILTTVSCFGHQGPYAHKVGFDGIAASMSGTVYMGGLPGDPVKAAVAWVDFGTATTCAFGTLAALIERSKTGKGQMVEGALLRTALTFGNAALIEQAALDINRVATKNRGQTSGPNDIFKTRDGAIITQILGPIQFERWCKMMGEEHWLTDPRFKDDLARGDNGEVLSERMARWCAERTTQACLDILEEARIPAGPVYSPQQALDDPHVQASGILKEVSYPGLAKPAPVADTPVRLTESQPGIARRAPTLGEHTAEVMRELGYDDAKVKALRDARVI
jgi:crotonobetainyl-CoA:carnitine CoA-transferase CaiB-like acyl-CoA transferase